MHCSRNDAPAGAACQALGPPACIDSGITVCLRDSALSLLVGACQTERSRLCSAESVPTQGARAVLEATKPCLLRWEHNQLLLCSTYCQPVQLVIAAACAPVRDTHAQGAWSLRKVRAQAPGSIIQGYVLAPRSSLRSYRTSGEVERRTARWAREAPCLGIPRA